MTLFSNQPGDEGLPGHERARVMAAVMTTTLMGVFDGIMINIAPPSMASAMQVPANVAVWFANGYLLSAAMTLAIFAAPRRARRLPPGVSGRTGYVYPDLARLRAGNNAGNADRDAYFAGYRRRGHAEYCPGDPALGIPGTAAWPHSGAARPAYRRQHRHCAGAGRNNSRRTELAMAVRDQHYSRYRCPAAGSALPRATASDRSPFDVPGALLSVILLGSMIMAANSVENTMHAISTVCWAFVATVSLIAFVWHIRRARSPILPPVIFSNGRFTLAALTSLASFVSQGITFIALPFLFQSVYGYSPAISALLFTPADRYRTHCAARGPLGRHDLRPVDLHA